jgi:hypothetical protein
LAITERAMVAEAEVERLRVRESEIERLEFEKDSLRLDRDSWKHKNRSDNEYLLARADRLEHERDEARVRESDLREQLANASATIAAYQRATQTDYPGSLREHQKVADLVAAGRAFREQWGLPNDAEVRESEATRLLDQRDDETEARLLDRLDRDGLLREGLTAADARGRLDA